MTRTRLYLDHPLTAGALIVASEKQAHYLAQVMRRKAGDEVTLFNGQDGEWRAAVESVGKKSLTLALKEPLKPQKNSPDLWLVAAPLKNARSEWVVEKATELGVSRILFTVTQFTVVDKVNVERLKNIAVEAAEQSERMDVPEIDAAFPLAKTLSGWPKDRRLIHCDESGKGGDAAQVLAGLEKGPKAVLIGPEGGFSANELDLLRALPYLTGISLGPRILRGDTAAVAALALTQASCGDWHDKPHFKVKT